MTSVSIFQQQKISFFRQFVDIIASSSSSWPVVMAIFTESANVLSISIVRSASDARTTSNYSIYLLAYAIQTHNFLFTHAFEWMWVSRKVQMPCGYRKRPCKLIGKIIFDLVDKIQFEQFGLWVWDWRWQIRRLSNRIEKIVQEREREIECETPTSAYYNLPILGYFRNYCCSSCSLYHHHNCLPLLVFPFPAHGPRLKFNAVENDAHTTQLEIECECETWCFTTTLLINIGINWSTCRTKNPKAQFSNRFKWMFSSSALRWNCHQVFESRILEHVRSQYNFARD